MKKTLLLGGLLLTLFTGCKKDNPAAPLTVRERLSGTSGKTWVLSAFYSKSTSGKETNELATRPACETDNRFVFYPDNRLLVNEGATKCTPTAPDQVLNGTWSLSNNDTALTLPTTYTSGLPVTFTLVEISNSRLIGTFTNPLNQSVYTATFTAK